MPLPLHFGSFNHASSPAFATRSFLPALSANTPFASSCYSLVMNNKKMDDSHLQEKPLGAAPPGGRKLQPPSERPTINTALARSASPSFSYAAVAAGSRSPSTASASNTTASGFHTSATSLVTPLTAFSQPASGISHKSSWETTLANKTDLSPHASTFVTQHPAAPGVKMPVITRPKSPLASGLQFGSFPSAENLDTDQAIDPSHGTVNDTTKQQANISFSNGMRQSYNQPLPNTWATSKGRNDKIGFGSHPLAQQPFGTAFDVGNTSPLPCSGGNTAPMSLQIQSYTTPGRHYSGDSDGGLTNPYDSGERQKQQQTPTHVSDNESVFSTLTPTGQVQVQAQASSPGPWEERTHKESYRTMAREHPALITEAMVNGKRYMEGLNPPNFTMNVGARALCIKTDNVRTIFASLKNMVWAAPEKVGQRINRVWGARTTKADDVILLFSISGQKCYCGMAIMRGPWKANNVPEDFKLVLNEKIPEGCLPVEWKFLKNVSYDHFVGITHPGHNQPIVNMWNGMHFPHVQGRQVIKKYVQVTHFTNVIVYRGDQQYNPFKEIRHGAQLDPTLRDRSTRPNAPAPKTRGGRGPIKGNRHDQRALSSPVTQPQQSYGAVYNHHQAKNQATRGGGSTTAVRSHASSATVKQAPPSAVNPDTDVHASIHANIDHASQAIQPGTLFMLNEQGALVLVGRQTAPAPPAFGTSHQMPMALTPHPTHASYVHSQQPNLAQNVHSGLGAGLDTYYFDGNRNSEAHGGPPQPFINVGNARMQQPTPRGGVNNSMQHKDTFQDNAANYTQGPQDFGIAPANQITSAENEMRAALLTRENLRAMQCMSSLNTGPSVAQNMSRDERVLRHIASASQVIVPLSNAPAPYTPSTPGEIPQPGTGETPSPLTTIPRPESEEPAPQRRMDAAQREYMHTIGRVVNEMMRRFPLEDGDGMSVGAGEEENEALSDGEEGGVALW